MKSGINRLLAAVVLACGALAAPAHAQTEVQFWHAMAGSLGERVGDLAAKFNAEQKEYKVVPVFKGNYDETLAAGRAAFRAKNPPAILQVFEVGTATMMASKGVIKPVYEVMALSDKKWDPGIYVPVVAGYYTDTKGRMLSLPFNSSTPVLYYNKDAFKKAGVVEVPKTWRELQAALLKIQSTDATPCGFTTGWQSWVQLETMSAWHNEPFASKNNGFDGMDARLEFNQMMEIRHISLLSSWVKSGLFTYAGRKAEPEAKFFTGECATMTSSSGAYGNIQKNAKFDFGVAPLPYYDEYKGAPFNSIIGGASLWVMGGKKPAEYKGVAKFFEFLSRPEIQADWHQSTGYVPITKAAYDLTVKSGYYQKNPGADVAVKQLSGKVQSYTRGVRLGNFVEIRTIIDEELENVWAGKKSPKQALDDAAKRGDEQLRKFEAANKGGKG